MTPTELAVIVFGGGGATAAFLQVATWATKSLAARTQERRSSLNEIIDRLQRQLDDEREVCDRRIIALEGKVEELNRARIEADTWAARMEGVLYRLGIDPPPRRAVNERP